MLLEVSGICQHCAEDVRLLVLNDTILGACKACQESALEVKRVPGIVYVVSNNNQRGVKIGHTTKSIQQRLKSLSGTGVPGAFETIAIFPSQRPRSDEQKVHEKLKRHNLEKEHFDLDPVDAVLKTYRALNRRQPIFFDEVIEETFQLRLDEARIKMKLRLSGQRG
jgi:hypothetical protein